MRLRQRLRRLERMCPPGADAEDDRARLAQRLGRWRGDGPLREVLGQMRALWARQAARHSQTPGADVRAALRAMDTPALLALRELARARDARLTVLDAKALGRRA